MGDWRVKIAGGKSELWPADSMVDATRVLPDRLQSNIVLFHPLNHQRGWGIENDTFFADKLFSAVCSCVLAVERQKRERLALFTNAGSWQCQWHDTNMKGSPQLVREEQQNQKTLHFCCKPWWPWWPWWTYWPWITRFTRFIYENAESAKFTRSSYINL